MAYCGRRERSFSGFHPRHWNWHFKWKRSSPRTSSKGSNRRSSKSTRYIRSTDTCKFLGTAGSTTTYHHPDHLSNRAETNSSGTRTRTFGHLPYGETWYETAPLDKWKFTTYERDSETGETGLDYAHYRSYSPSQGRFMCPDLFDGSIDLQVPQSLNSYAYVLNDP